MSEWSGSEAAAIESVAVVGAGAMGAMYAAHLARAGVGVRLVARGERARRLTEQRLTVNGESLDVPVWDADTDAGKPVDLVLVAVKHQQLAGALDDVAALVGPQTTFLSVLNGLGSERQIAERFGHPERVLPCIALAMDAERAGTEIRFRQAGRLVFGDPIALSGPSERVRAVQALLDAAGLDWETPPDMRPQMWWKFMVNVGVNQASAVLDKPYGAFVEDGPARWLMLALMTEVIEVGRAEGVDLGVKDLERWDHVLANQPAEGITSMHQDVLAGRSTEVDIFAGEVVELGIRHSIPTPYNQTIHWILHARMDA
ncbi:ketopantoate reductase family protein [Granulicoccus phenolivorans]|uniref:ketopantoate reductase family protein n=1 Tax=Granulicoccus phenolivorans TaxID=266854 RepID=UPI00047B6EAA|nr:2-dehydropantoate 2-reductase [Granulicoccus phenolivorans]